MTVDFGRLLAEQRAREALPADERDTVVTFKTTRGEFSIPAELLADDREDDLRRHFARHLPLWVSSTSRRRERDGSVTVTWRQTRVVDITP